MTRGIGLAAFAAVFGIMLVTIPYTMMGKGGFKRMVTLTGVYSVCRPDNYDVVCFLDADSKNGGLNCVPLSLAGGKCTK